jgi:MFS family permease
LFLAPLLVSLAVEVQRLVGTDAAPRNLALVTGVGSLLAMVGNPIFGRWSDRTISRLGMRRHWMLIGLSGGISGIGIVAVADRVAGVLAGWCMAQVFFLNALLAAQAAVLPDQVPPAQRGLASGVLGVGTESSSTWAARGAPGSSAARDSNVAPMSRRPVRMPCTAAPSSSVAVTVVVPSPLRTVRTPPSQAAQWSSRWPSTRIS